jgi:Domain of unknown function (DUF4331)
MADHLDSPGLKSPNMDARIDITDIYAFQKPGEPSKSILILNVNPLAPTLAKEFDPDAVYELKIDNNGDTFADIAFRITFSHVENGKQFATVRRATGRRAAGEGRTGHKLFHRVPVSFGPQAHVETSGPYRFFAGIRSDPFFFDLMGFLAGFKFTGTDFFIDKNVFSMVLEVPNRQGLGPNPKIGCWARVLVPTDRDNHGNDDRDRDDDDDDDAEDDPPDRIEDEPRFMQADRMGRPAINTVFNHGEDKNTFNRIPPSQDRTTRTVDPNPKAGVTFLKSFELTLEKFGHPASEAEAIAKILLPDILTYDYSSSAGFLNGRKLTDDVIDIELNLVTHGQVTTDKVGPHKDLLTTFPFLGHPH